MAHLKKECDLGVSFFIFIYIYISYKDRKQLKTYFTQIMTTILLTLDPEGDVRRWRPIKIGVSTKKIAAQPAFHLLVIFSFLYLKKLKFQKYMPVSKNFKNIPRSPYGGDRTQM